MNETSRPSHKPNWLSWVNTALICAGILAASIATIVLINRTEPTAEQIETTRKGAALVETITVHRATVSPKLTVLGSVEPAQDISLSPRVGGQVIELSPKMIPGGMVRQGELLLKIDPADFANSVSIRQSELEQAQASLKIEQGRQSLAKKELALLEGTIDETNRALVLREPQIASIRAEVSAAQAALERAQLDLERTNVYAPFDAQIIRRAVNVGSQVSPGDDLAQLVGIEEYWVMASVPVRSLRWVQFPAEDAPGSAVTIRNPDTWPSGSKRTATVARMIGTLDQQTRLARVLISVPNPLAVNTDAPPLILNTLVETEIEGREIEDVVKLHRRYLHESDTVWVMKEGKLEIRTSEVVFRDADHAYIRSGLDDGDRVVTSTLATVAEGINLRDIGSAANDARPLDESESTNGETQN